VCRNPDASDCFILDTDFPALLETRWQRWYAFASSSFHSGHTNAIPVLGGSPVYPYAQGRIYRSRRHVTSEPLGPIAPSAPPAASIRERAIRRDGWLRVQVSVDGKLLATGTSRWR